MVRPIWFALVQFWAKKSFCGQDRPSQRVDLLPYHLQFTAWALKWLNPELLSSIKRMLQTNGCFAWAHTLPFLFIYQNKRPLQITIPNLFLIYIQNFHIHYGSKHTHLKSERETERQTDRKRQSVRETEREC